MVASGVSKSIYLEDLVMAPAIVLASKGFWTAIEKMLVGTPSRAKRAGRCLSVGPGGFLKWIGHQIHLGQRSPVSPNALGHCFE